MLLIIIKNTAFQGTVTARRRRVLGPQTTAAEAVVTDKKEETDLGATNDDGGYQERRYSQDSNEYVSMYQSGAS